MPLTKDEIQVLRKRYGHLTNYVAEEPDAPIDPLTYVDSNGNSLLHIAASLGDLDTVRLLLKSNIDVNQVGDMGNTALHCTKSEELAKLLFAHGASVDIYNEFGNLPQWKAK